MAQYPCPQCGGKMFIEAVHEGYEVPCPHCGDRFRVPRGAAGGASGSIPGRATPAAAAATTPPTTGEHAEYDGDGSIDLPESVPAEPPSLEIEARAEDESGLAEPHAFHEQSESELPPPRPAEKGLVTAHRPEQDPQGVLILVFGILGVMGACPFLSPVAWIMGHQARNRARDRNSPPDGLVTAGWVMGIIGTIMWLLLVGGYAIIVAVVLAA